MQRIIALIVLCFGFLSIWAQYDMVGEDYGNGLRRVKKGEYYGFIDEKGKEVIPVKYFYLEEFTNGKSLVVAGLEIDDPMFVGKRNKYGMIDRNGEAVVGFEYDEVGFDYGNGLRRFAKHDNWNSPYYGFINENGKVVIPVEYYILGEFSGGKDYVYAQPNVHSPDGYLIDKTGLRVSAMKIKYRFHDGNKGLFIFEDEEGHNGIFDSHTGNILVTPIYRDIGYPSDGMIRIATEDRKYGYLDAKTLKMAIQPQYEHAGDFSEGLAAVSRSAYNASGYIDKKGNVVIPFIYTHYSSSDNEFLFGFCGVSNKRDKYAIINANGEELTPYQYNDFTARNSPMGFEATIESRKEKTHYFDHNGVQYDSEAERDIAQFEIMKKRAADGDERYYAALGDIYSDNEKCRALGLAGKNDELALEWYLKAAEIKDSTLFNTYSISESKIFYQIGRLYEDGLGTEKNLIEAKQWYEKSAGLDLGAFESGESRKKAQLRLNELGGIIKSSTNYATIAWPKFQAETTQKEYNIEFDVNSDSKIEDITLLLNGVQNRGIKTVESSNYDLSINQIVTLNEGANTIKVSVRNAAGTTEEEKTVVYRPQGSGSPTIDWLEYASTTDKKEIQIKLGIKSKSRVENVTINNEQTRGIATVTTDDYDMIVNKTLTLDEGQNRIVVSVSNADGTATSEKIIEYKKNSPKPVFKDKRIALVIGNSDYSGNINSLANPQNDAADISEKLKSLGFDVTVLCDGTRKEMKDYISSFIDRARDYDVALFYYAGHGLQLQTDIGGANYLIPVDAELKYKSDAEFDCVNANRIVSQMESSGCKVRLVILDACRDLPNLLDNSRGTSPKGFAEIKSAVGTFIMYSTREGRTASDGNGRNSPFAEGILKYLDEPNLPIEAFFKKVGDWVDQKTGNRQEPWPSGRIKGDFYFNQQ